MDGPSVLGGTVTYLHLTKVLPEVLEAAPVDVELVDVSSSPLAYFASLERIWGLGEGFATIEHDVVWRPDIEHAFEACEHPWCTFVYSDICHPEPYEDRLGWHPSCREAYRDQLGCTRFRRELVRAVPDAVSAIAEPLRHWARVNEGLGANLRAAGYGHHWHEPVVKHLHSQS